jgi:hypothetical protein
MHRPSTSAGARIFVRKRGVTVALLSSPEQYVECIATQRTVNHIGGTLVTARTKRMEMYHRLRVRWGQIRCTRSTPS